MQLKVKAKDKNTYTYVFIALFMILSNFFTKFHGCIMNHNQSCVQSFNKISKIQIFYYYKPLTKLPNTVQFSDPR